MNTTNTNNQTDTSPDAPRDPQSYLGQRLCAEILFHCPEHMELGMDALEEDGFETFHRADRIDPYGPTAWLLAWITLTPKLLDDFTWVARVVTKKPLNVEREFWDFVDGLIEPFRGEIYEAGLMSDAELEQTITPQP